MRILIAEDDKKTAAFLKKGLSENGFVVDVAHQGTGGLEMALSTDYSLLILDVMLPQKDGLSILNELREKKKETPVLFLTAKDSVEDRVKGLSLGADDYLVKPFAFSELLARIQSVLRRGQAHSNEILRVADLEIDSVKHKVTRGGNRIELTQKEFLLLSLLARRTGQVLSRTLIAEQVWDMNFNSDTNIVDVVVRRLRKKMDETFSVRLIHTVRGVGYVLEER